MSNITIADAAAPLVRRDLALYYAKSGQLWMAVFGEWDVDAQGQYVTGSYDMLSAREFRGGGRGRYLSRDLVAPLGDPNELLPTGTQRWTDYLSDLPYGDFDVTLSGGSGLPGGTGVSPVASESMRYLGTSAQQQVSGGATRQYHGDLIDSTMLLTDGSGAALSSNATAAYTAFGEPLTSAGLGFPPTFDTRYQYAGGWGYESGHLSLQGPNTALAPLAIQHVGARWYQPDAGRFVQRDPIGLSGGMNLYGYCLQNPLVQIDPEGHFGEWYPGAPVGSNLILYWTPRWLDSPNIGPASRRIGGLGVGLLVVCFSPPAALPYVVAAGNGWTLWRLGGGGGGSPPVNDVCDGIGAGVSIGTAPRLWPKGPPRRGTFGPGTPRGVPIH